MQTDKKDGIVFVLKCGDGETREQQCQTVLFMASDQRGHDPPDLACVYWTIHIDTQILPLKLVDNVEYAKLAAVHGRVVDEVPGLVMVGDASPRSEGP